jgi:4-amino-4-deoxy-L-arabinose transferase-like glycosyltransferase
LVGSNQGKTSAVVAVLPPSGRCAFRQGYVVMAKEPVVEPMLRVSIVAAAALGLLLTAPLFGEFWWSDAPRHALNGVFLHDLLLDFPSSDIKQWAINYYIQYPALTILFYPPVLPVVEAAVFMVFDVSPLVAVLPAIAFDFALAIGVLFLARRWLTPWQACAAALLLIGFPEIALWGRQPMTDIPAFCFLVWSAVFLLDYRERGGARRLYLAFFLFLLGLYTKQSIIFFAPVAAIALVTEFGWRRLFARREIWIGAISFAIALIPLVVLTVKFGQGNVQSVVGIKDEAVSRGSIGGWIYYLRLVPHQTGWLPAILSLIAIAGFAALPRWRLSGAFQRLFLGIWFAVGYLFFTAIDLKEPRLDLAILLPFAILPMMALSRMFPKRWADVLAMGLAATAFGYTLIFSPVPRIAGYREAAAWIAANTEPDAGIVFSGKRDGSFIFNLRALDPQRRHSVIRADKLLLSIAIRRDLGVVEKDASAEDITDMFARYGVTYIVAERDFWIDLKPMATLQQVLDHGHFEEMTRIEVSGNVFHPDRELRIYRNLGAVSPTPERMRIDLPIVARSVEGTIGGVRGQP